MNTFVSGSGTIRSFSAGCFFIIYW